MLSFPGFIYHLTPAVGIETIEFKHIRDKKELKAVIWKPKGKGPFPLIAFDVGLQFRIWEIPASAEIMARAGYVVLGTEYSRVEIAKGEVQAIINAIEYAHKNFPFISPKTVLVGVSMGGATMLNIASKAGERLNVEAVIAMGPFADLARAYYYTQGYIEAHPRTDERARLLKLYQKYAFTTPAKEPKEFEIRSPMNFVKNIKCPVYLIHGKDDEIVSMDHSIELYHKMKELKKDVHLKIFPGEGIHTPLKLKCMLTRFNFWGFFRTWNYVHKILTKLSSK
ncbi:MAG: prolyl oligopeptidase family serine peptidase [Elusimicrobia bacterium]|nr:prolyl oligopeptidase family serine peptidase [Elusimicrobiota bacterium]